MKNPPAWLKSAVFYQVYPQSFHDSNGDGIGDLPGLIAKLDYIAGLGCNAIWLNPCFVSPFKDAGYDVSDFYRVDPRYGTNADLRRLFRESRRKGIRVLLDLVAGHTSDEHPWFIESSKAAPRRYRNRYIWTRDWLDGVGSGLSLVQGGAERNGNYLVNFFACQPALNYGYACPDKDKPWQLPVTHPEAEETRAELRKIMKFWLGMGASGFRVDMAASLVKNDPGKRETIRLWRELRTWLERENPEAILVSEWGYAPEAVDAGFHADFLLFFGTRAYTTLFRAEPERDIFRHVSPEVFYPNEEPRARTTRSFFDRAGRGDICEFLGTFLDHLTRIEGRGYMALPTGNHDMPRLSQGRTPEELAVIFAFIFTMPAIPFIYYGDEIGMQHIEDLPSKEGGYTRTGSRTPMQWDGSAGRGFSEANPSKFYLPVDTAKGAPQVAALEQTQGSLLHTVRALSALRAKHPALAADAEFEPVFAQTKRCPFVYVRRHKSNRIWVALNPAGKRTSVELPPECAKARVLAGKGRLIEHPQQPILKMPPFSFWIAETT